MSLATLVGGAIAIPINWWMVKNKLKHGMGTEKAIGKSGTVTAATRTELKMNVQHRNVKGMEMNSNIVKDIKDHQVSATDNKTSDTGIAAMNMEPTASSRSKIFLQYCQ